MAVANASNNEKLSTGDVETFAPDSMMPARNGGATSGSRRVMTSETDQAPADWPCNTKLPMSAMEWWRASLGNHTHHDCYHGLVSPELGNIVLHPGERELLVEKTEVVIRARKFL